MTQAIATMVDGTHVVCHGCADTALTLVQAQSGAALYPENLDKYGQDCHVCSKEIQTPLPGFPVLFGRDNCRTCRGQAARCARCLVHGTNHSERTCIDPEGCGCPCISSLSVA